MSSGRIIVTDQAEEDNVEGRMQESIKQIFLKGRTTV
jgi:hypothetical protein